MTKEEAREAAKIMLAWADGKEVETKEKGFSDFLYVKSTSPTWNWYRFDFRIKAEPTYRPFKTADEVMDAIKKHGDWVIDGSTYRRIDKVTGQGSMLAISLSGLKDWGINELPRIEQMCFLDSTPFGVKEEEV